MLSGHETVLHAKWSKGLIRAEKLYKNMKKIVEKKKSVTEKKSEIAEKVTKVTTIIHLTINNFKTHPYQLSVFRTEFFLSLFCMSCKYPSRILGSP